MKLVFTNINDIVSYKENLRFNREAIDMVIESINDFGFINPIIVNKNNVVISGETRLQAAKLLKLNEIPCIVIEHLTDEQERIYRLVDNKTNELSIWNYKELNTELSNINENLLKYDLLSDDDTDIDISAFFEGEYDIQTSLFDYVEG